MGTHWFAKNLLSMGAAAVGVSVVFVATLAFARSPRTHMLEPHLVLTLPQILSPSESRCLEQIAASEIRFCEGESEPGEPSMIEVHLRTDYRNEWGAPADREQVLKEAHHRLVNLCGISAGMDPQAFAEIIGTPLAALGNSQLTEVARSILETTSRYFYGVSFEESLKHGIETPPKSRCKPDPFLGM